MDGPLSMCSAEGWDCCSLATVTQIEGGVSVIESRSRRVKLEIEENDRRHGSWWIAERTVHFSRLA